jgi:hypothetical protein
MNTDKKWLVLTFLFFELEEKTNDLVCTDYLAIYLNADSYTKLLAKFCENELSGKQIFTNFKSIVLIFSSDSLEQRIGFSLETSYKENIESFENIKTAGGFIFDKTYEDDKNAFREIFIKV